MMTRRTSLKGRNRVKGGSDVRPASPKKLDVWLDRMSNLSQPLLLALAVFGYFYTVIPVYQKELLSEQIAAKEVELGKLQLQIETTLPAMDRLRRDAANLEAQLASLSAQKGQAERMNSDLLQRQHALASKNAELEALAASLTAQTNSMEANARAFSMRTYHDSFSASVSVQYVNFPDTYALVDSPSYEAVGDFLLTPYRAIASALSQGDSRFFDSASQVPREVKDEYHQRMRAMLEARRDVLSKPLDDINALVLQIQQQMKEAAVDPTPGDRFNEKRFETRSHLVDVLTKSRKREWERTRQLLDSLTPPSSNPSPSARIEH